MKTIIEEYPYINVNMETEKILDSSYLENPAANIPEEIIAKNEMVENIGSDISKYDRLWAEIK